MVVRGTPMRTSLTHCVHGIDVVRRCVRYFSHTLRVCAGLWFTQQRQLVLLRKLAVLVGASARHSDDSNLSPDRMWRDDLFAEHLPLNADLSKRAFDTLGRFAAAYDNGTKYCDLASKPLATYAEELKVTQDKCSNVHVLTWGRRPSRSRSLLLLHSLRLIRAFFFRAWRRCSRYCTAAPT
jgi:hypothetical protein